MENIYSATKHLSDIIGEEYRKWKNGDIIFITAPTGCGKSFFILHTLLKDVILKGGSMLYLVNRRILKEQLEKELFQAVEIELIKELGVINVKEHLSFCSYQEIESSLKRGNLRDILKFLNGFNFLIYDESHYFYTDSNFNTYTQLSFDCLRKEFDNRIQIFMSATMDKIETFIRNNPPVYLPFSNCNINPSIQLYGNRRFHSYSAEKDYNYIDLYQYENMDQLKTIIKTSYSKGKEKWLVFSDSIEKGKKLRKELTIEDEIDENDILFIDADYHKDVGTQKSIYELTQNKCLSERILISTAVIDNGVSFHDKKLKNIVILADTEESFIQMLGRKRSDGERVALYVCKRDKKHFSNRLSSVNASINLYRKHKKNIEEIYVRYFSTDRHIVNAYTDLFYISFPVLELQGYSGSSEDTEAKQEFSYYQFINYEGILHRQQNVLNDIIENKNHYQNASEICYYVRGIIALNLFAVQRCFDLKVFYTEMMDALDKDENAFLIKQAEWLGISYFDIQKTDSQNNELLSEGFRNALEKEIRAILKDDSKIIISKEDNINFKLTMKAKLLHFLKLDGEHKKNLKKDFGQNDRALMPGDFNKCMELAGLQYHMEKVAGGGGNYLIAVVDADRNDIVK